MKRDSLKTHQISDGRKLSVSLLNYGARIIDINFAGHSLALGYDNTQDYLSDPFYLGATIGPITNRIANAQLSLDDKAYTLPANEGNHCLHSGGVGFDKELWELVEATESMLEYELNFDLARVGLLGLLKTTARYCVTKGTLRIDYISTCDTSTYINLTNHVYLNLSGHNKLIDDHNFSLIAQSFARVDRENIPTGELTRMHRPLNYRLDRHQSFAEFAQGIDHHFNSDFCRIVSARSLTSGIHLNVLSNAPGFQFYTGAFLDQPFERSSGFCVETQLAPDAINQRTFYSPLLKRGDLRKQTTLYQFSM